MTRPASKPPSAAPAREWQSTEPWIRAGRRAVVWVLGGLAAFAWLASISGAVVSAGMVTVESSLKSVQHLDGGIVQRILVRNGDKVEKGDLLIRLDETAVKAALAVIRTRIIDLAVQEARLEAERAKAQSFELSGSLAALAGEAEVERVFRAQKALFEARLAARLGERAVLTERVAQVDAELRGLTAQLAARTRERDLNARELANVRPLFDQGFANQQRLGTLERDAARLEGEVGRLQSDIARANGAAAEARLKLAQSEKDFIQSVVDELRKVQQQLAELREQRTAARDRLDRMEIRAPHAGRVHALAVHTEGGVIQAGREIMQIVPEGEKLVIEAHIPPQDIDRVRAGLVASVRFPAFNARTTPKLTGKVAKVSPAQLTDGQGKSFFTAQIDIPASEMRRIGPEHRLVPGMPAEVYIETGARSILSYLVKPLEDAAMRSLREN